MCLGEVEISRDEFDGPELKKKIFTHQEQHQYFCR